MKKIHLKSIIYNWLDDYIYYENQTFIKEIVNVAVEYFKKIQQNLLKTCLCLEFVQNELL